MVLKVIPVVLPDQEYPIYIGSGLLNRPDLFIQHIKGYQILIVTQQNIAKYYLQSLLSALKDFHCDVIFLQEGEQYKNIIEWQKIFDVLLQKGHERSTTLIALGGGVVGDMTGFAAACYQRGVNYIQVPTTLIAQVDSSIGGKTGVNHALGKNMLGQFHQPQCVIADSKTLTTLPDREFAAGMAEVVKYGLIHDKEFFDWLYNNPTNLMTKKTDSLHFAIAKSISIKADIVSQDVNDVGVRNLLNFGHTFGHALETATEYQVLLHGEAVAIGIIMAARLSVLRGLISNSELNHIQELLSQFHLLQNKPYIEAGRIIELMMQDKKTNKGRLNVILLQGIGKAEKVDDVTLNELNRVIKDTLN